MDYISSSEASERWHISKRRVQVLCEQGRVKGAYRFNRFWMIPINAEKPGDPRREKPSQYSLDADLLSIITATLAPMPRNNPDSILDNFDEDRLRLHYEGELAYLRGDFERVIECFARTEDDDASRLRACSVTIAAAISLGDYDVYTEIEGWLKDFIAKEKGRVSASVAELALAVAAVSAIAPGMAPEWLKIGDFSALPVQARPDAAYKRAKYFICFGNFEAALATAQTALAFCEAKHGIAYADIYLLIICSFSNYSLKRPDEAKRYLIDAMNIALPYGFITPFAEMVASFGGLMETLLEQEAPEYHKTVTDQWERVFKNWLKFHNTFTKDNITLILTHRDYEIAKLAAQGLSDEEIGTQIYRATGTVKNKVDKICQKLGLYGNNRRKELSKFIL